MSEQVQWDDYDDNIILSEYLRKMETRNPRDQLYNAFRFVEKAVTKALSPHNATWFNDKTFLEKIDAAHNKGLPSDDQVILSKQQWDECRTLHFIKDIFDKRPDVSFDSSRISELCSKLTFFDHYKEDGFDNRLRYITSAHRIATDTFYRWVI